jgi:heme/copper-type cytochrome/quinol oxidase subunit 2
MVTQSVSSYIKPIAQAGLLAKGVVYCLLGVLAFMAAFNFAGQSTNNTDKEGVFSFVHKQTGGQIMLAIIALGLLCYCLWRGIQAFGDTEEKGKDAKGIASRARYMFSGLVYASLAAFAIKILFSSSKSSGENQKQDMVQEILNKPLGEWLLGIAAAIIIGVGIYQIYYGLSEKYSKHVENAGHGANKNLLLLSGKIGYVARGFVWLIIGWLFTKAAFNSNSSEAGETSKAFKFLAEASYGSYILAAVGLGLICYGLFNFVRVKYENF